MSTDRNASHFDAVAAARELEDSMGDLSPSAADTTGDYVTVLESEVEQLTAALAKKDEELRRANARADQAYAEIEAVQRRVENNAAKELEQRTRKLLESFLPVIDDLDRAIAAARVHGQGAELLAGVELVRRQLLATLGRYGVTHAPALGELFDPNRHEAIAAVPVTNPAQDKRVVDVMREGYLIGDQTLRPASVAVGKR
ncbi:MAG: nucleotide exchange factor GrpE [Kofleriaceae bacterium]|nr:nucleotide exchange factor GrpE [Kofleriaceae bacterium]